MSDTSLGQEPEIHFLSFHARRTQTCQLDPLPVGLVIETDTKEVPAEPLQPDYPRI